MLITVLFLYNNPHESLQILPSYSLEDLQQSNPFGGLSTQSLQSAFSSFSSSTHHKNVKMNLLLYITTHFSDQHLRYFHCCWPKLVQESPLISSAHILIVASNHTPVDSTELNYLSRQLFHYNPSYQIQFLDHNNNNPCEKFRHEVPKGSNNNNPLKLPVNYKQCMANWGVRAGFEQGWVHATITTTTITGVATTTADTTPNFDWMIRINPDVLIRKSKWLLQTMQASVDAMPTAALKTQTTTTTKTTTPPPNVTLAIVVHCATRQLHTDFFALRPHYWNASTAFGKMGRKGNKWNHERTAYREMAPLLSGNNNNVNVKYLPDVDPSEGSCRVRGTNASVYHVHDSCQEGEGDMVCLALENNMEDGMI